MSFQLDGGAKWRSAEDNSRFIESRATLRQTLGDPAEWPEALRAWGQEWEKETAPELKLHGLMWIARRAEHNHPAWAAKVYSQIAPAFPASQNEIREATERLQALQGQGWSGEHWEILGSRFVQEIANPTPLLAFGAGSLTFRGVRGFLGNRLAFSEVSNILTRGRGLAWSAKTAGLLAESASFALVHTLGPTAGGQASEANFFTNWRESALFLGALRFSGWGARTLAAQRTGSLFEIGGQYGGILLGHYLSDRVAGRDPSWNQGTWLRGLAELFQFQIGSQLARKVWGPTFFLQPELPKAPRAWHSGIFEPMFATAAHPLPKISSVSAGPQKPLAMQMASLPPVTYAAGSSGFASVKTIRSPLGQGQTFLDIGTRNQLEKAAHAKLLVDLEDGFSSLLHGYRTRESNLLRGPISDLLRADSTIGQKLLEHVNDKERRLWGLIDADTGFIQRLVALDESSRPKTVLALTAGIAASSQARLYQVFRLELDYSKPELPAIHAERMLFDGVSLEEPRNKKAGAFVFKGYEPGSIFNGHLQVLPTGLDETPFAKAGLSAAIFPGLPFELKITLSQNVPGHWELKNGEDKVWFKVSPSGRERMHLFQWSAGETIAVDRESDFFFRHRLDVIPRVSPKAVTLTPPKPVAAKKPPKPVPLEEPKRESTDAMPPPASQRIRTPKIPKAPKLPRDVQNLTEAATPADWPAIQTMIVKIDHGLRNRSENVESRINRLKNQLNLASPEDFKLASDAMEQHLENWLSLSARAENLNSLLVTGLDPEQLNARALLIAGHLVRGNPPTRAGAFQFFRETLHMLDTIGVFSLQTFLNTIYPIKSLNFEQRLLVQQVHILIDERLKQ